MILRYSGKNLLYFESFDLEFSEGLNVITGETGAGKSVVLKGLQALFGKRVELFENENTWLEVLVSIDQVDEELREMGIQEGEHVVTLNAGKRWTYRIDGRMYPQSIVERLFEDLVHFHQQNTHVNLLKKRYQLSLLDKLAGNERLLSEYTRAYRRMVELEKLLNETEIETLEGRIEQLDRELSFFERHKPSEDEERSLRERFERISRAKQLLSLMDEISHVLSEDSTTKLWKLAASTEKMVPLVPKDLPEMLRDIAEKSNELQRLIRKFVDQLQLEDSHELETRLNVYNELRRRFGPDWEEIRRNWQRLEKERKELLEQKQELEIAESESRRLGELCLKLAQELHENRLKAATELERQVRSHLSQLAMNLDFSVKVERLDRLTASGFSDVDFVAGVDGGTKPLKDVLSGGELSRVVLAVHLSVANGMGHVFVFDEIDSGIGGTVGNVLGEKLKALSKDSQVIVVTHLPQIARLADTHFTVVKDGNTMYVKALGVEERKSELLRMIGGEKVWGELS